MNSHFDVIRKNCICYDWLNFTSFIDKPHELIKFLGMAHLDWKRCNPPGGLQMYRSALFFGSIYICWGLKDNWSKSGKNHGSRSRSSVCVSMSGSGCRSFENFSKHKHKCWEHIFKHIVSDPDNYNITRLDVAYDDFEGILDIVHINALCFDKPSREENISSLFSQFEPRIVSNDKTNIVKRTQYFGSYRCSDCYMRVYDKAIEMRVDFHWVRWEISLKRDNAFNFAALVFGEGKSLGDCFAGLVLHYVRFIYRSQSDMHNCDYVFHDWYLDFIGDASAISLSTKHPIDYNLDRALNYALKQYSSSAALLIAAYGKEGFFNLINDAVISRIKLGKFPFKYNKAFKDFLLSNDLLFYDDDHLIEKLFADPDELELSVFERGVKI